MKHLLNLSQVTSLAAGQFFIELQNSSDHERQYVVPIFHANSLSNDVTYRDYNLLNTHSPMVSRPRAKSKPDAIFIHPTDSNLARADARALELGLAGATDRVARQPSPPPHRPGSWGQGEGRAAARAMLVGSHAASLEKDPERRQLWNPSSPESDGYDSP